MAVATIEGPGGEEEDYSTSALMRILMANDIVPGSEPDYTLAKEIYLFHPLGAKVAEAPIKMAQSQPRKITVQGAPEEVTKEFLQCWEDMRCEANILNVRRLARVYGVASLVLGCEGLDPHEPIDMRNLWEAPIYFNVFDPLNMSGSIIMNQVPNTPNFNQVTRVIAAGKDYHRSRYQVVCNEEPIYISFTDSSFGFAGRSVYQRALYPLKSFIKTMIADDMIATKNGLLIAKMKAPGSVPNKMMAAIQAIKRMLLKAAHVGEVLSIGEGEDIATINMQNVDGAGTFARDNILKNIATAADMPAKLLQNETMVGGMAEGTEDAKNISKYIDGVRFEMKPNYDWCDNLVRYRAWMSPLFYKRIQALYPEEYGNKKQEEAFTEWCRAFSATWPSMLVEPDSESIKLEEVKLESCINVLELMLDRIDPENQAHLIEAAMDNIGENKKLFPYSFSLDMESLLPYLEEREKRNQDMMSAGQDDDDAKSITKLDASPARGRLRAAVARLQDRRVDKNGL